MVQLPAHIAHLSRYQGILFNCPFFLHIDGQQPMILSPSINVPVSSCKQSSDLHRHQRQSQNPWRFSRNVWHISPGGKATAASDILSIRLIVPQNDNLCAQLFQIHAVLKLLEAPLAAVQHDESFPVSCTFTLVLLESRYSAAPHPPIARGASPVNLVGTSISSSIASISSSTHPAIYTQTHQKNLMPLYCAGVVRSRDYDSCFQKCPLCTKKGDGRRRHNTRRNGRATRRNNALSQPILQHGS